MALYLYRFSYSPDAWEALVKSPEDRRDMLAARIFGTFGGELQGFWYSFGEYDGYAIAELPDNVSAAAVSAAIASTGALHRLETTPLITVEEMVDALDRAADFAYRAPGGRQE
jgi:uncharacterized protein with GYD domain